MPTPTFILELRELVGHRPLFVPSVMAAIFDDAGRLLVVRTTAHAGAVWSFPGGIMEPGERPEDAIVREVREETGLDVQIVELVAMHGGPEFHTSYPNGDEIDWVAGLYRCDVIGGMLSTDDDEIAELRWVTLDEALALTSGAWFPLVVRTAFAACAPAG